MNYFLVFVFGFLGVGGLAVAIEQWLTAHRFAPAQLLIALLFLLLAVKFLRKARAVQIVSSGPPAIPVVRRFRFTGWIVGIVLAIALAGLFGNMLHKPRTKGSAREVAAADWKRREFQDLSFEAPFNFSIRRGMLDTVPKEAREVIQSFDCYQSTGDENKLHITVSRIVYSPEIEADIDRAVEGGMTAGANRIGDKKPDYTSDATTVGGLEARRTTYSGKLPQGKTIYMDALFAVESNKLWQVQTVYMEQSMKTAAARVLDSVEIQP